MSKRKYNRLNSSIIAIPIQDIDLLIRKDKSFEKKFQCKKCQTIFELKEPYCPECHKDGYNVLTQLARKN